MKAAVEIYKGIEYIQISTLPQDQRNEIMKSLSDRLIIKILRNDSLLRDCIQYRNYEFWYENIFSKLEVTEKKQHATEQVSSLMLRKLALQGS
jgi:hypothetical protein